MWQDKKYQFITLFIYLYEDHLVWDEVGFAGREFTLYYTDIISVSGGNAGKHLGGTSRFEINTAGQTYKYNSTLGAFNGLEECIQIINERIQHFRNNGMGSANSASFANNININPNNIEPTITRIDNFLEDGEWDKVYAYSNAALDYFPTDFRLYKYLLLADMKCKTVSDLKNCSSSFASNGNYKKLERYADDSLKKELKDILEYIEKEPIYRQAYRIKSKDKKKAVELFTTVRGYKDSNDHITALQNEIRTEEQQKKEKDEQEKNAKYLAAVELHNKAETLDDYKKALDAFEKLNDLMYEDSQYRYTAIKKRYEELVREKDYSDAIDLLSSGEVSKVKAAKKVFDNNKEYKESATKAAEAQAIIVAAKAKTRKKIVIIAIIAALCLAGIAVVSNIIHQKQQQESYDTAISLYENGEYEQAKELFDQLDGYEDAMDWSAKCADEIKNEKDLEERYKKAVYFLDNGGFKSAIEEFKALGDYSDSQEMLKTAETYYDGYKRLVKCDKEGDFVGAQEALNQIADRLDKDNYEKYSTYIEEYGAWVGTYTFKSGDANAVSRLNNNVKELNVKMINHILVLEYDGESVEVERKESTSGTTLESPNICDFYYIHNFADHGRNPLVVYLNTAYNYLEIEYTPYADDYMDIKEYSATYEKKE